MQINEMKNEMKLVNRYAHIKTTKNPVEIVVETC
jgi:hypothetical protein